MPIKQIVDICIIYITSSDKNFTLHRFCPQSSNNLSDNLHNSLKKIKTLYTNN